jgi:1,4-alpha-glucan branching enzyme
MYALPGKKLLFMGSEFAQWAEWNHDRGLDWHLLQYPPHTGMLRLVGDLNRAYGREAALHVDFDPAGFEWIDAGDSANSVVSFLRKGRGGELILCIFNFTPVAREDYRVGVPRAGTWREIFNSDSGIYGGSDTGNGGGAGTREAPWHGRPFQIALTLPPLGGLFLKWTP